MSEADETQPDADEQREEAMLTAARSVVRTCMQVRQVESVLIITDQSRQKLAEPSTKPPLW